MSYRSKNSLGLGQPGYAAERYVPTNLGQANYAAERYLPVSLGQPGYAAERYVLGRAPYAEERYIPASLGQPGYAAERYVPMSGLGQTKTGTTTTSKTGTTSGSTSTTKSGTTGEDTTARDFRTAADVGGSLIGGIVRGFTGGSTTTPATTPDTTAMTTTIEPAPSGGMDWYWPVVISGGLILIGGIGYFALKGKKSAPTPNRRKRVSRNAGGTTYIVGGKSKHKSLADAKAAAERLWQSRGIVASIEVYDPIVHGKRGSKRVSRNRKPADADPIAARELLLVTENEYSLYRLHQDIEKNLLRKLKSGKYDHSKAAKAWQYWMDAGAKLYVKQYGGSFSPATRAMAAREYADQWYASYKAGDMKANGYGRSRYGSYSGDPRWMAAKYAGVDSEGKPFKKGDEILYWPRTKKVMTGAKADQAWLDFLSAKGDEEGMPFARNSRRKRSSRR